MALALLAVPLAVGRRSIHAAEPVKPDEDPAPRLLELKDLPELDPIYTDPKMMERHLQKVDPRFNNSLATEMGLLKPTFEEWCDEFKDGSRVTDFDSFTYDGPVSNQTVYFNLGSFKTGSTSVQAAAKQLGFNGCKLGWESGGKAAFDGAAIAPYQKCPIATEESPCDDERRTDVDRLRNAPFRCQVLGDAPWPFAWPTVMRAFPKAKFILSRQKTCADWVYHVNGLWNGGYGRSSSATCWCGSAVHAPPRPAPPKPSLGTSPVDTATAHSSRMHILPRHHPSASAPRTITSAQVLGAEPQLLARSVR